VAAGYSQVSPGYFRTMNIPLLQGRDFTEQDRTNTTQVVMVDETFVKHFKLGTNVLGRRILIGDGTDDAEIIGLVKDIKHTGIADAPRGEMYRSYKQKCWGSLDLIVRTQRDPAEITRAIRAELDGIDKDQPIVRVATMNSLLAASEAQRHFALVLFELFAVVGLILAAIGIYGVLSGSVTERTREIGVRAALGATRRDILSLVIGQGMTLAVLGVGIGLLGAIAASRTLITLLFGVSQLDPITYLTVIVLLLGVAAVACGIPGWRATQVNPSITLRAE